SIQAVPSRRSLASHARRIQRRELPRSFGSSPIGKWTLVASTTWSRRPFSALATISSDSPCEYTSAVSTKLIPASSAWVDDPDRGLVIGVAPLPKHHRPQAQTAHRHTRTAKNLE